SFSLTSQSEFTSNKKAWIIFLSSESINVTFNCDSVARSVRNSFPHHLRTSDKVHRRVKNMEKFCNNTYLEELNCNGDLLESLNDELDRSIKESIDYYEDMTHELLVCGKVTEFAEEDMCNICWETISGNPEPNNLLEISPCQHKFCFKCIQDWVRRRSEMPIPSNVPRFPCPYCTRPIEFLPEVEDPRPVIKNFQEGKEYMKYFIDTLNRYLDFKDISEYVKLNSSIMGVINEAEKIESKWTQFNDVQYVIQRTET
ncbi:hypothetical protein SNEBB_009798, partial [Seison nebaliae]